MFVTLTKQSNNKKIRLQIARIEGIDEDSDGSTLVMATGAAIDVNETPEQIEQLCMDAMVEWSVEIGTKAAMAGARAAKKEFEDKD